LEQDKVCLLVMIGVRADGTKELVALADGFRESSQSWADVLRSCRRRGMTALVLAVGDGALGFWKALREVFPDTREQRCWFHVSSNVLAALPKSAHPGAKAALAEIHNAEDRDHALKAVKAFEADYGAKWPKAVAKITELVDVLLAFFSSDTYLMLSRLRAVVDGISRYVGSVSDRMRPCLRRVGHMSGANSRTWRAADHQSEGGCRS
jgi:putative transposase